MALEKSNGEGEHSPKPDQKSILDIMAMKGSPRCDGEKVASFSVYGTVGEALNGKLKLGQIGFKPMLCW